MIKFFKNIMGNKTYSLILTILSLILAISVIVLSVIVALPESAKENITEAEKYYNNKCSSFITQNVNLAKGQIVFVGDSITDLYVLDDHYSDLPLAAYNRGIGGDTTKGVLKRLKVSIFDIEPSKVVLMIGTNDVNGGCENDDILQRYGAIVDNIFEKLPEVELFCMSIIPQNEQLEEYSNLVVEETTTKIIQLNSEIKKIAELKGAMYVDLFSQLVDENNRLISEYSDDGLHLNFKGLCVWTNLIKPYL